MSTRATRAECAVCAPALPVATRPHSLPGVPAQRGVAQNHREPSMKPGHRVLEELRQCSQLSSSCSPQPALPSGTSKRKFTPAPLATGVLIAFSCRDTKYLCKQYIQIATCKCTYDTFMKYVKYVVLSYDLICVYIWKPFPCFGSGTEHFWQFVWGKQSQSVSMIHYQHIW